MSGYVGGGIADNTPASGAAKIMANFKMRGFGPKPMQIIHGSYCEAGAVVGGRSACSGSSAAPGYGARGTMGMETNLAISQLTGAAQQFNTSFGDIANLATSGSTTLDKPPVNAHQDAPMNNPRRAAAGGNKNPRGAGEVSSFDHRQRHG